MNPKVSIAVHSGVFEYWPLLQNLLKSFVACNEYPNVEIILVESGGNKKIRDWFERIDFNDFFVNFNGQKTNIKKHPTVTIEKTLKFIDFDSSIAGLSCYSRAISQCINSFKGDFFVMMAEDNQFTVKGDLISEYISILDNLGKDNSMIYFLSQQKYKLQKKNNKATGPHKTKTTDLRFFTPSWQKWDPGAICSRELYARMKQTREDRGIEEEKSCDVFHGLVLQNCDIVSSFMDFKRIYPAIPCGLWMDNDHRDSAIAKIIKKTTSNSDYILYNLTDKSLLFDLQESKSWAAPLCTEDFM